MQKNRDTRSESPSVSKLFLPKQENRKNSSEVFSQRRGLWWRSYCLNVCGYGDNWSQSLTKFIKSYTSKKSCASLIKDVQV